MAPARAFFKDKAQALVGRCCRNAHIKSVTNDDLSNHKERNEFKSTIPESLCSMRSLRLIDFPDTQKTLIWAKRQLCPTNINRPW
jgi:hypothetical protein